jgi:hemerythrin-like domain-containing protein
MNNIREYGETPSSVLTNEHKSIKQVLEVLRELARQARDEDSWETEALHRCVEFFRLYADGCHHAKEEDLLFPVMEKRGIVREGGPIGVMLFEHKMAREFTAQMAEALGAMESDPATARPAFLKAAEEYIGLLTHHIYKEDFKLFPMGDNCMTEEDQGALYLKFCDVDCGNFDGRSREELEQIAADLVQRWSQPT